MPVFPCYANFLLGPIVYHFGDPSVAVVSFPLLQFLAWQETLLHSAVYSTVILQLIASKVNSFSENISTLNLKFEIQDTARHSSIYICTSYAHLITYFKCYSHYAS